jgi:hypothetical protein
VLSLIVNNEEHLLRGVLEEDYSSVWACISSTLAIHKKNGNQPIVETSPISYSKDWGHDPFNAMVYLCFSIGLKYGYYHIKLDVDIQNHSINMAYGKYKY